MYLQEFIGSFFLMFIGAGAELSSKSFASPGVMLGISWGFTVLILVYLFHQHYNPAISLGLFIFDGIQNKKNASISILFFRILAQILGATLGTLVVAYTHSTNFYDIELARTLPKFDINRAIVLEIIMTTFLFLSIKLSENNSFDGLIIGFTVTVLVLIGGPFTGTSINPARSFTPCLISWQWDYLWFYIVSTFSGGILGSFICLSLSFFST